VREERLVLPVHGERSGSGSGSGNAQRRF
jgi:hypothetical protein